MSLTLLVWMRSTVIVQIDNKVITATNIKIIEIVNMLEMLNLIIIKNHTS